MPDPVADDAAGVEQLVLPVDQPRGQEPAPVEHAGQRVDGVSRWPTPPGPRRPRSGPPPALAPAPAVVGLCGRGPTRVCPKQRHAGSAAPSRSSTGGWSTSCGPANVRGAPASGSRPAAPRRRSSASVDRPDLGAARARRRTSGARRPRASTPNSRSPSSASSTSCRAPRTVGTAAVAPASCGVGIVGVGGPAGPERRGRVGGEHQHPSRGDDPRPVRDRPAAPRRCR